MFTQCLEDNIFCYIDLFLQHQDQLIYILIKRINVRFSLNWTDHFIYVCAVVPDRVAGDIFVSAGIHESQQSVERISQGGALCASCSRV